MSELGNKLRDARIEKGYTLNTLQQMTKIQKKYLQAIEEGNYNDMPGSFYVRAFVKQYADMVGLDGDSLLLEYEEELRTSKNTNSQEGQNEFETLPTRSERYVAKEKNQVDVLMSYLPLAVLVAIIVMIMIALVVAINSVGKQNIVTESVSESNEIISLIEPEIAVTTSKPETTEAQEIIGENDIKVGNQIMTLISDPGELTTYELHGQFSDYTFEFEGNNFVWVGAFEDGAIVLDTTINSDETLEHTVSQGTEELRLTLGYPEGAKFKVNGQVIEPEGQYLKETVIFKLREEETINLDLPTEDSDNQEEVGE